MYCQKCGFELPNDSVFCTNCGEKLVKINTRDSKTSKTKIFTIISVLLIAVIVCSIFIIRNERDERINEIGKANLKRNLMKDWSRAESDNGTYYELVLDFFDYKIDYNYECGIPWVDSTLNTYSYEVISPNQIKVTPKGYTYERIITIKFNEEMTMMTMTPALTSMDSSENWFFH